MSGKIHYFIATIAIVLASVALSVLASPTGAPLAACESMIPQHGVPAQTGRSPYRLTVSSATYSSSSAINVTIAGDNGESFKGFLLQAHTYDGTASGVGVFSSPTSDWKLLKCFDKDNSAATHTAASNKTSIVITWVAPNDLTSPVYFTSTIVQKADTFWVRENSTRLEYAGDAGRLSASLGAVLVISGALLFMTKI